MTYKKPKRAMGKRPTMKSLVRGKRAGKTGATDGKKAAMKKKPRTAEEYDSMSADLLGDTPF